MGRTQPAATPECADFGWLLVQADADGVTFSSFDYETSAQIHVTAAVADEGQVLVSGRLLADISRSLPPKPSISPPMTPRWS